MLTVKAFKSDGIKVIPLVIYTYPTAVELAANRIIILAIHIYKTCAKNHNIAALTNELSVNESICMTCSRNRSSPIHYRTTYFAVCSACIAVFCTSCILVFNCSCSMVVPRIDRIVNHGLNMDIAIKCTEYGVVCFVNKAYFTVYYLCINKYDGTVTGNKLRFLGISGLFSIPSPYSNGNACESLFTAESAVYSGKSNSNNIAIVIKRVFSLITGSYDHILVFPLISCVKIDLGSNSLNILCFSGIKVYIIQRAVFGNIAKVVVTAKNNGGITGYGKTCALEGYIAHLICNFKGYCMFSCCKINSYTADYITGSCYTTECYTVNINLCRSVIKAGCVCCNIIYNLCIKRSSCCTLCINSKVADYGRVSVINSRTVIESDVVDIEYQVFRCIPLGIETQELRLIACSIAPCIKSCYIIITADICIAVYPSSFGNIGIYCACKVLSINRKQRCNACSLRRSRICTAI